MSCPSDIVKTARAARRAPVPGAGPCSPIQAPSLVTLAGLSRGACGDPGDARGHRKSMTKLSVALVLAGLFTLAPRRIAHAIVMGWTGRAGFAAGALLAAAGLVLIWRWWRGRVLRG